MELDDYQFSTDGMLMLNGTWDFYWHRLLTPEQIERESEPPQKVAFPSSWNRLDMGGEKLPASGYATYRLQVMLTEPAQMLALKVPMIRTAYRLWVNGQLVSEVGKVGTTRETSSADYLPKVVPLRSAKDKLDIVLQISNFDHRLGGAWNPLLLGTVDQIQRQARNVLAMNLIVLGSLISMGLHHLGLVLLRRKEKSSLYFGLFCILIGVREMFIDEAIVYMFWPDFKWLSAIRIEYVCFFLAVPLVMMFIMSLFPKEVNILPIRIVQFSSVVFIVLLFVLKTPYFTYETPAYQVVTVACGIYVLYCLVQAMFKKRDGALFALAGAILFVAAVVTDIFYYNQFIGSGEIASYGLLAWVFMISFTLSSKSAKAFMEVENLSRQMREMNVNLERKIWLRTAELEKTNASLELMNEDLARLETSRRHLLSNISHDLGTPMTLIQGYVEALLDGVVTKQEQQHKYLQLIHNRITGLNRLISDLFQLSKLEARQMDFDIQPMTTEEFMVYFAETYALEVSNAGLRFQEQTTSLQQPGSPPSIVKIDVDRIDQVFTNIIFNAVKHTPKGGLIQLHMIVDDYSLVVQIQDNGSGIDPEDLPYIFDRFYKKDKSRNTATGGSGLGLAIAKEIIDYHGGRIWAQSRVGQGACIAFMLPLVK